MCATTMYFLEEFENTLLAYMIYQVMMPDPHGMYIQYRDLYWRSLHSNHLHHSHTLQYWLHRCRNRLQSIPVELHSPDLQSICTLCNIVYWHLVHSNRHYHNYIQGYCFHHHNRYRLCIPLYHHNLFIIKAWLGM